jgi:hypothetical protein
VNRKPKPKQGKRKPKRKPKPQRADAPDAVNPVPRMFQPNARGHDQGVVKKLALDFAWRRNHVCRHVVYRRAES